MSNHLCICCLIISLLVSAAAFVVQPPSHQRSIALQGGFLDGKAQRITVREDEDAAMWVEEPKKKEPAAKKTPAKKTRGKVGSGSKVAAKKSKPEFKFPWQK